MSHHAAIAALSFTDDFRRDPVIFDPTGIWRMYPAAIFSGDRLGGWMYQRVLRSSPGRLGGSEGCFGCRRLYRCLGSSRRISSRASKISQPFSKAYFSARFSRSGWTVASTWPRWAYFHGRVSPTMPRQVTRPIRWPSPSIVSIEV